MGQAHDILSSAFQVGLLALLSATESLSSNSGGSIASFAFHRQRSRSSSLALQPPHVPFRLLPRLLQPPDHALRLVLVHVAAAVLIILVEDGVDVATGPIRTGGCAGRSGG